ncbi:hypothetical protein [Marinilabilia rubra]|uniref:hypothetical protein n=1 Tax=Marinilabilia rubra TaxID=2162893 RepID=UPI0011B28BB3|nr:hypothetical protein [Marinilabilia rubra]
MKEIEDRNGLHPVMHCTRSLKRYQGGRNGAMSLITPVKVCGKRRNRGVAAHGEIAILGSAEKRLLY